MTIYRLSQVKDILKFEGSEPRAYWRRFIMLLSLSVVIATMGLLRNSGAVVIAAMLIARLMTPILGVAAALIMGWTKRASGLLLLVCVSAMLAVGLAWLLVSISDFPRGVLIPQQIIARTDPGIEDLIVALAAGMAGAYVQIQKSEISLLPGAAIGVSLVPPLAAAGILLYFREVENAYEAGLLFATNFGAIVIAACMVYIVFGWKSAPLRNRRRRIKFSVGVVITFSFLAAIVLQLMNATYNRYNETKMEVRFANAIQAWADPTSVEIIRIDVKPKRKTADVWLIVDVPLETQYTITTIADLIPKHMREVTLLSVATSALGREYSLVVRYQTRIAGVVSLQSPALVEEAPAIDELSQD